MENTSQVLRCSRRLLDFSLPLADLVEGFCGGLDRVASYIRVEIRAPLIFSKGVPPRGEILWVLAFGDLVPPGTLFQVSWNPVPGFMVPHGTLFQVFRRSLLFLVDFVRALQSLDGF